MAALFTVALVAGCAARTTASSPPLIGPPGLDGLSAQELAKDLARGRRTRAEVTSRLGDATIVRFDTGYEVWVYRITEPVVAKQRVQQANRGEAQRASGELVILLAPSGEVVKVRTRIAPASEQRPERGSPAGGDG
ncbi:MAG: hypothetical protein ACXW2G_01830 [Burkholderiaceae bacterium]